MMIIPTIVLSEANKKAFTNASTQTDASRVMGYLAHAFETDGNRTPHHTGDTISIDVTRYYAKNDGRVVDVHYYRGTDIISSVMSQTPDFDGSQGLKDILSAEIGPNVVVFNKDGSVSSAVRFTDEETHAYPEHEFAALVSKFDIPGA